MLSTLSACLIALAVLKGRGLQGQISPERSAFGNITGAMVFQGTQLPWHHADALAAAHRSALPQRIGQVLKRILVHCLASAWCAMIENGAIIL